MPDAVVVNARLLTSFGVSTSNGYLRPHDAQCRKGYPPSMQCERAWKRSRAVDVAFLER